MPNYQKMYLTMFHAATDALEVAVEDGSCPMRSGSARRSTWRKNENRPCAFFVGDGVLDVPLCDHCTP